MKWNCVEWIICINCVWLLTGNTRWMTKMLWKWHKNARHRMRTVRDRIDIEMNEKKKVERNRATTRKENKKQDDCHKTRNPHHTQNWKRIKRVSSTQFRLYSFVCFSSLVSHLCDIVHLKMTTATALVPIPIINERNTFCIKQTISSSLVCPSLFLFWIRVMSRTLHW